MEAFLSSVEKENVVSISSGLQGDSAAKTPPRQPSNGKKRGPLAPIDNSPAVRPGTPKRQRQRRASSIGKRVSFGGQQIKVYDQNEELWTPPQRDEEGFSKSYDETAEDTVTMPNVQEVLDEKKTDTAHELSKMSEENVVPRHASIFMDDDVLRVQRSRLSEVFDVEDTETITLGGHSRQNSDLSEGDITKNIPSIAELVGTEEACDGNADESVSKRRRSGSSDESDSFDRMYGKVFGDDATEDDLTNFTAASNATVTHNITTNVPSLEKLIEDDKNVNATVGEDEEDENVTRELPTFSALVRQDFGEEKYSSKENCEDNCVSTESANGDAESPPSNESGQDHQQMTKKLEVEQKLKRLSEPVKLGKWSENLIESMEKSGVRRERGEETDTQEITAELADDIFHSQRKPQKNSIGSSHLATSEDGTEKKVQRDVRPTFEDFLRNANLRFLDDLNCRRQRETSYGDSSTPASPERELTAEDKMLLAFCTSTLLQEVNFGSKGLEKAIVSTRDKTYNLERQLETERPFVFQRLSDTETLQKEELNDLQLALKRLKNFCRLLARRQWYEWRAGFESSAFQKLAAQKGILAADQKALSTFTEALGRCCAAADADAEMWSLKPLPSRPLEPVPAELVQTLQKAREARVEAAGKLRSLQARQAELVATQASLQQEQQDYATQKEYLKDFSASLQKSQMATKQVIDRSEMLNRLTGLKVTKFDPTRMTVTLSDCIEVTCDFDGSSVRSTSVAHKQCFQVVSLPVLKSLRDAVTEKMSSIVTMNDTEVVREASLFVQATMRSLNEMADLGELVSARSCDGAMLIGGRIMFSRLATRRKFIVELEQKIGYNHRQTSVRSVQARIGTAPSVERLNMAIQNATESLVDIEKAIACQFL